MGSWSRDWAFVTRAASKSISESLLLVRPLSQSTTLVLAVLEIEESPSVSSGLFFSMLKEKGCSIELGSERDSLGGSRIFDGLLVR